MVGAMAAVLGGLDALVFTGGTGEHSARVRGDLARALAYLGLRLDEGRNAAVAGDTDIATDGSTVRTLVIAAREDLAVLREVRRLLG
jgi:acetate kinase